MGAESIDKKLFNICKTRIDIDKIISNIIEKSQSTKIILAGLEEFSIIYSEKENYIRDICSENIVLLDDFNKDKESLDKKYVLIYLGVSVGGIEDSSIYNKYLEIKEHISSVTCPVQNEFSKIVVNEMPKSIKPYFKENRNIKISIIVLTAMNNCQSLKKMLKSFKKHTPPEEDVEVIVVNNGSKDESIEVATEILGNDYKSKFINCPKNYGIPGGFNEGIDIAEGNYVCLLQDDITFSQKNWHRELEYYLDEYKDIGLIGGYRGAYSFKSETKFNKEDLFSQPYYSIGSDIIGRCKWDLLKDYLVEVDYANCMNVMFRKKLGKYDENFIPNGLDDIGHSFQIRELGYKIFVTDVGISHGVLMSSTRKEKLDIIGRLKNKFKRILNANKANKKNIIRRLSRAYHYMYFEEKYGDLLRELPKGADRNKITLDEIAANNNKIERNFKNG